MELTPSQKKTVRHQFDSFCRKVLREEARDYERHIAWRSNHEVSLSELSEEQERQMYVLDEYPFEQTHFHVQGYDVAIENEDLANALTVLPDDKRDIVLLAYFLDMTDQEIADKLDMVRRTVQYKRAQSLKELKKEMEVTEDGAQSEYSEMWDPQLLEVLRSLSPSSRSIFVVESLKSATRNFEKLLDILEFLLTHDLKFASTNFYIENGHVERRIKPLRAGHTSKEIQKNLSQTAGLGYRHAAALNQL